MATLAFDLYWSFRSPYSYIALPRILALHRAYHVTVDIRIVHPAAIRNPAYFHTMNPLARPYFLLDSARAAAFHGLPFRRPVPDPIVQDPHTLEIAKDQPHIYRLSRLGIAAAERGCGLAFGDEVSRILWDGTVDNWHIGQHLSHAAERAGLSLDELDAAITADPDYHEQALAMNDTALRAAGHWGVPTAVFMGEPFFGQDRIDVLIWRLKENGLRQRQSERSI